MAAVVAASALMAGAQIYTSRKQRKAMKEASDIREREAKRVFDLQEQEISKQEKRLAEQQKKQEEKESEEFKSQKRDSAAARRRKRERGSGGRASTILTGAQGVQDDGVQRGRTLLGV